MLAQEQFCAEALLQAGAVWEPKKVQTMIDDLKRALVGFGRTQDPPDAWETVSERLARGGIIVTAA